MSTRVFCNEEGHPKALVVDGVEVPNVSAVTLAFPPGKQPIVVVEFSDLVDVVYPDGAGPDEQRLSEPLTLGQ